MSLNIDLCSVKHGYVDAFYSVATEVDFEPVNTGLLNKTKTGV